MLSHELENWRVKIEKWARDYGLDFFPVLFEILDWKQMNEVAAYGGFPNRYPHWRFGMEFEELSKSYSYGLSKIYEMVINNDPCYAYLLHSNAVVDQKLVMAHVYGHCDFFKNNVYFTHTNRHMMDEMANHKSKMQRYIDKHGYEAVETLVDTCLSIDNLIDYHAPFIKRTAKPGDENAAPETIRKLKTERDYLDKFINPTDFIKLQKDQIQRNKDQDKMLHFPVSPQKDIMGFLLQCAPLEPWEQDVLEIIRGETYYFAPQGQTKIMNEGWASYWHSIIMTHKALEASEFIDFADHHSGTVAMSGGRLNPYKIGLELFRDIEERWNKGKFGKEYDECDDMAVKKKWNTQLGLGKQKIFEVRKIYNDVTFIDEFLTREFCVTHKLFAYDYNRQTNQYEISSRDFNMIKQKLLSQLTNFGQPYIEAVEANYDNRGELLLRHRHDGVDLDAQYARDVLHNLYTLWKRPTLVETRVGDRLKLYCFDGKEDRELDTKEGA